MVKVVPGRWQPRGLKAANCTLLATVLVLSELYNAKATMQCRRLVVVTNPLVANHLPVGHWLGWRVSCFLQIENRAD